MELANLLYQFFGFDIVLDVNTFPELLAAVGKIGCGLWLTIFIIRSLFMATTIGERRFL